MEKWPKNGHQKWQKKFTNMVTKMVTTNAKNKWSPKKVKFLNKKTTGHYNITPFTFKPKKGQNFKYKPSVNFYNEILKLVKEIKNEKRFKNFN